MYVLVRNGSIATMVPTIPKSSEFFPDISNLNRLDDATLLSLGWFPLTVVVPTYDTSQYAQGQPMYEFLPDQVVQTYPLVALDPAVMFSVAKQQKIVEINSWYANKFTAGFLSPTLGYSIPSQRIYVSTLQNKYTYMNNNNLTSMFIIAFDGTSKILTADQGTKVINELSAYLDYIDQNNLALLAMVDAATTIEEVNLISTSFGAYVPPVQTLAQAKAAATVRIKGLRGDTLSLFQKKSPGVAAVYADNIDAAIKYSTGNTEVMPTGQTPIDYLTGMGIHMGMTGAQFGAYIISENHRLSAPNQTPPSAYDVEVQYIASSVGVQYATTVDAVNTIVSAYQQFVSTVTGN